MGRQGRRRTGGKEMRGRAWKRAATAQHMLTQEPASISQIARDPFLGGDGKEGAKKEREREEKRGEKRRKEEKGGERRRRKRKGEEVV